jgi:hypothetical protein
VARFGVIRTRIAQAHDEENIFHVS